MEPALAAIPAVGDDWLGLRDAAVLLAGAGGLGRVIAEGLVAQGARVYVVDRDAERAEEVALSADLVKRGGGFRVADLQDARACRDVVADVRSTLGRLDVLVHAVGINLRQPVLDFTDDQWTGILDTNLNSAWWLAQAAGRVMCEQRAGRLVFLSSVSGLLAHKNHVAYAASKGGLNQMMRVMAAEWAAYGVTVNAVGPGYVETPLTKRYLEQAGIRDELETLVPMGRLGAPADVANAVAFLASRRASFITGHVLYVDGGRTLV